MSYPSTAPLTGDVELDNNFIYALNGPVFVGNGINADGSDAGEDGVLSIDAGTTIIGTQSGGYSAAASLVSSLGSDVSDTDTDYLVITPGSKLNVSGTSSAPVIMTGVSDLTGEVTNSAEAQWGGLVISLSLIHI